MLYNAVLIITQDWSSQNLKQICVLLNPAVASSQPEELATPPTQPSRFLTETAYLQRIISLVSEGGERPSSGPALLTPAQMVNHMTSRRRVHGFHACVHVYVQEVSEWPGTMDNKTFNSLFHRLPCQRSGAANNQNYSVSECVQMCACACAEKSGSRTQGASLFSSIN